MYVSLAFAVYWKQAMTSLTNMTAVTPPPAPHRVFCSLLCSQRQYLLFTSWSTLVLTLLTLCIFITWVIFTADVTLTRFLTLTRVDSF